MQIMYDILSNMEGRTEGLRRTAIMYNGNLSHDMLKKYLGEALSFGFILTQNSRFFITAKGDQFLYKMRDIADLFKVEQERGAPSLVIH